MSAERDGISVVVPVYNSAQTLEPLVDRITRVLEAAGVPFEIVLVNDGSRDDSWQRIVAVAEREPRVSGLNLMRNFGQHNALLAGIRTALYGVIVSMDDDLQHPPEEIPVLLAKLDEGYDVVYGVPERLPHAPWRNVTSWAIKRLMSWAMGIKAARQLSAFRAFRADLRQAFAGYQSPTVSVDVLLSWGTTRFGAATVRHDRRTVGSSNYSVWKLVRYSLTILTGFSAAPLRVASFIGFAFTVFGASVLVYVVVRAVAEGSVPGFPFLASIISIFSGAQLFALGIIGEYLASVHARMLDRPTYVVREHTSALGIKARDEDRLPASSHTGGQ